MFQVEYRIAQDDQGFLMLALEHACEGLVIRFDDDAFPDPLPELRLRSPELLAVATDDQSRTLLLPFFLAQFVSLYHPAMNRFSPSPRDRIAVYSITAFTA